MARGKCRVVRWTESEAASSKPNKKIKTSPNPGLGLGLGGFRGEESSDEDMSDCYGDGLGLGLGIGMGGASGRVNGPSTTRTDQKKIKERQTGRRISGNGESAKEKECAGDGCLLEWSGDCYWGEGGG